jgi:hypothetical protein
MLHRTFLWLNFVPHALTHICFIVCALLGLSYRPSKNDQLALKTGLPRLLLAMINLYQHLTVCTQGLTVAYLAISLDSRWPYAQALLCAILFPMCSLVGIGWWALVSWSPVPSRVHPPWTMFPRHDFPKDDAKADHMARALSRPTQGPLLPVFCVLQLQHCAMPLIPWVEQFLYPKQPTLSLSTELCVSLGVGIAYLGWAVGFCWHVRGEPPYPVLQALYQEGTWPQFYAVVIFVIASICAAAYAWRKSGDWN